MPKISVLLPMYNAEAYICEAVTSITEQSFKDFELIIINDGSTDGSLQAIERYRERDSRIKVIDKKNSGIIDSLNLGIAISDSDFIARMDSDDICNPLRFELQEELLRTNSNLIVCGSNIEKFGAFSKTTSFPQTDRSCKNTLLLHSCFAHPSVMLKRKVIDKHKIIYKQGYEYAEDYKLWSDLANFGEFFNIEKPLIKYRIHSGQTGSTKKTKQRESHVKVSQENLAKIGILIQSDILRAIMWPKDSPNKLSTLINLLSIYLKLLKKNSASIEINKIITKQLIKFIHTPAEYT